MIQMCGCENPYKRMELINTMSMYSCTSDDCLVISDRGEDVLRNEIGRYFSINDSSIGAPAQYLGGKLRMVELENGQKCWAFG